MSQLSAADRIEIEDLLVRYCTGIDRADWDLFGTVFTADCRLDYGAIGHWSGVAEVTDYMAATHAEMSHTLHRIGNVAVTADGEDRATSRCYVSVLLMDAENRNGITAEGYYDDVLRRTAEGWRIAERTLTMVATTAVVNTTR